MAMNKKEQAELAAAKDAVRVARALNWSQPVAPDVAPPTNGGLSMGYLFSGDRVVPACSSSVSHGRNGHEKVTTQGSRWLYSTPLLALRALRHEKEQEYAADLARIDKKIEEQSQGEQA